MCGSFVYPQCKLCSRPSKFSRCRSWSGFLTARCCASTGTWLTSLMQRQVISRCDGGGASIQFIDEVVLRCGQRQVPWENCGDSTGPVLEHGARGLRVLAHRQGPRCSSDQRTLSCSTSLLTPGLNLDAPTQSSASQARHSMTMIKVWVMTTTNWSSELRMRSRRWKRSLMGFFRREMLHFSRSSWSSGVERHVSKPSMAKSSLPSRDPLPIKQRFANIHLSTSLSLC